MDGINVKTENKVRALLLEGRLHEAEDYLEYQYLTYPRFSLNRYISLSRLIEGYRTV